MLLIVDVRGVAFYFAWALIVLALATEGLAHASCTGGARAPTAAPDFRRARCEHLFVSSDVTILHARPRLVLRLGRAARRPAAARAAGHRRRRASCSPRATRPSAAACARRWAAPWPGGCARRRSSSRRGCRPTRRPAGRCSRSSRDTSPLVEGLSIDEAFLDVRGLQRIAGPPLDIAVRLRRRGPRARRPAHHRRGGADEVPGQGGQRAWPSPTACWWCRRAASSPSCTYCPSSGCGASAPPPPAKLHDHGITSVGEVARIAEPALVALVGRAAGRKLHALAHNRDPRPVKVGVPPALHGHAARARAPAALARGARCGPGRDRRPHRPPPARRPPRVPDRGAAPALPRLHARDPVAHAAPCHPADRAHPRHRAGAAGDGHADDRAPGPDAARHRPRPTSRTPPTSSSCSPSSAAHAIDEALDSVRDRFGTTAITRAVLLGREQGQPVPLLPD